MEIGLCFFIFITILVSTFKSITIPRNIFDVTEYGALGNGNVDDSKAFLKAWNRVCSAAKGSNSPTLMIPKGKTFLVHPTTFLGPCNSNKINIMIEGNILAPTSQVVWKDEPGKWLKFKQVNGLTISGSSMIDGKGKFWWRTSCKYHKIKGCTKLAPTALAFEGCNNIRMSNITFVNGAQTHIHVSGCQNVDFSLLTIKSPKDSPNTDGIHLQSSTNVLIHNSNIASGDDCISIGDHTSNINITQVNCGPGHGISIGSLGKGGGLVLVENISVSFANISETTNGARIKTWQVGNGNVRHVAFSNINFTSVEYPIIIDQHYCDVANSCPQTETGVQINDVLFSHLSGTSVNQQAIDLNCSEIVPCKDIVLDTINFRPAMKGQRLMSYCSNAYGFTRGSVEPRSCLLK